MSTDPQKYTEIEYVEVPIAEFNAVPKRRARYIIAYALVMLLTLVTIGYNYRYGNRVNVNVVYAIWAVQAAAFVVFYWNFVKALRTLQYPLIFIAFLCLATILPMPGILAVAWVDIRVAKVWDAASPGPSYRKDETPGVNQP